MLKGFNVLATWKILHDRQLNVRVTRHPQEFQEVAVSPLN